MIERIIMKLLLFLFVLTINSYAYERGLICVYRIGKPLSKVVVKMGNHDKYKHCTLSCTLTNRCGGFSTYTAGVLKELQDLLGPGNAELKDILANVRGIRLASTGEAKTFSECAKECLRYYPYRIPRTR